MGRKRENKYTEHTKDGLEIHAIRLDPNGNDKAGTRGEVNEAFDTNSEAGSSSGDVKNGSGPRRKITSAMINRDGIIVPEGPQPSADNDNEEVVSAAHEYLTLKGSTATLSHEGGANFYLRLGCLRKDLNSVQIMFFINTMIVHFLVLLFV